MPEFLKDYATEAQCEQALEAARWPKGFRCPRCAGTAHYVLRDGTRKVFQCTGCRHQASLIARTVFQGHETAADHLVPGDLPDQPGQERAVGLGAAPTTGRELADGLADPPQADADHGRPGGYLLEGNVQVDDAYLGGERTGGKVGRGSENKVPFIAAVSLSEQGHPLRARLTSISGFTSEAVSAWAKANVAPTSVVFFDGLACFGAVTGAGCRHQPTVMAGRKPKDVPEFK